MGYKRILLLTEHLTITPSVSDANRPSAAGKCSRKVLRQPLEAIPITKKYVKKILRYTIRNFFYNLRIFSIKPASPYGLTPVRLYTRVRHGISCRSREPIPAVLVYFIPVTPDPRSTRCVKLRAVRCVENFIVLALIFCKNK